MITVKKATVKDADKLLPLLLELDSKNIAAMNNLANSYKALNKIDLAEELYLKVNKTSHNIKLWEV